MEYEIYTLINTVGIFLIVSIIFYHMIGKKNLKEKYWNNKIKFIIKIQIKINFIWKYKIFYFFLGVKDEESKLDWFIL
jgi:hypothetical protein